MNELTASAYRSLVEAARADGPSAAARTHVWSAVSEALAATTAGGGGGGNGGSGAGGVGGGGAGASAPWLFLGAGIGGAVGVGFAVTLLCLRPSATEHHARDTARAHPETCAETALSGCASADHDRLVEPPIASAPTGEVTRPGRSLRGTSDPARAAPPVQTPGTGAKPLDRRTIMKPERPGDALEREALLLTRARAAVTRGDGATAMAEVQAAMSVPGRQLIPEELSIESKALRLLGRTRDADHLDSELRSGFPESALAR
ncbi:MAG: hypothetical protein ABSF69_11225 [Polyangiaceae bacterium]|jgi:hypothetical protein